MSELTSESPMTCDPIVITGATGTIGRALLAELAARGCRPKALVRPGSGASAAPFAEVVAADLERPDTVRSALAGASQLFLLTPFHPHQDDLQRGIVDAARQAGVEHIVKLSALGADPGARTMIHRQHGRAEQAIAESGMAYTLLRPNAFMQNAMQWLATIEKLDAIVVPAASARVSMIDARDVAAVAARALTEPRLRNSAYDLTGPEALGYADVAGYLSSVCGRTIRHLDLAPADAAKAMRAAGMPDWAVRARLELYSTYRAGEAERVSSAVPRLTGRPARRFGDFAEELADRLRRVPI
jgi:uncharacterized protein YbjT (DUF2867 family)